MTNEEVEQFVKIKLNPQLHLNCPHCKKYFDVDEQTLQWQTKNAILQWLDKTNN